MTAATRWRPRRAGIVNLYEYGDQVFDFAGGRLLLRGHNTSGKTKALELLLPFCLDGDIRPTRLDPFASGSKDMKWNLVGCTPAEQRTGYVWLEFERIDESGRTRRLTAGIGLRAHQGRPEVTRWYFVARDRRVGTDLLLLRGREPIGKSDLAAELGEDGELLDGQRDYRARLNDLLFGFASAEQYQTMLRLMLELRRPHLSKTLDPDGVAAQLSAGLPEVDDGLMRRLAGGLEQLETLERALARLRDVRERVRRFHQRTYSAYARAVVRDRADALRQAETAVASVAERLRATRAACAGERAAESLAAADRDAAEADVMRLTAEERALMTSGEWSSVEAVEALRREAAAQGNAAGQAREHAETAAAAAAGREGDWIAADAAAREARDRAEADLTEALGLADRAGLAQRAAVVAGQLRDGSLAPEVWGTLLRDLVGDWRDVLHRHRELLAARRAARAAAEEARAGERAATERLTELVGRREAGEAELDAARDEVATALDAWRAGLVELSLDDDTADAAAELARSGRDPAAGLTAAAGRVRAGFSDARSATEAARAAALDAQAAAEAEIAWLAAEHDDGPPPPGWDRAARADRAGAPLWRIVDFRADLGSPARAALEGGLAAMGLLDAWVTPSGRVEDPLTAEVVLAESPPVGGPSLADVLEAVPGQPVAASVVASLLAGVGLGERADRPWVDLDGRFALGPLRGRGAKAQAEHIGASAREARRTRRIAVLRERVADLGGEIAGADAELAANARRRGVLDAELAGLPGIEAVVAAADAVRVARALEADGGRAHEQAVARARLAGDREVASDAERREHAAEHGLAPQLDERLLDGLREACAELVGRVGSVARAWTSAAAQTDTAAGLGERLAGARREALDREARARDEQREADRLDAEHAAREAALGTTGERLRTRHAEVQSELRAGREAARRAGAAAQTAALAVAGLERDVLAQAEEHDRVSRAREEARAGFAHLGVSGILRLVLGAAAPVDLDDARTWTLTRALELARGLPDELLAVQSSAGRLAVDVQQKLQLLDRELAESDMGAYVSPDADGLLLVRIQDGAGEQSLTQVLESLDAEIADRERVLSAAERRVFGDALVEEIADHLRARIHEVRGRVEHMNAVLRRSPTAGGKIVELDWQPQADDAGIQQDALALLRKDVRHLSEEMRAELVAFFRRRVALARTEHAYAGEPQPMAGTLATAFDYRRWFAFGLYERSEAGRVRLTKKRHGAGSGGEQSVLIHLPLFAAAAALYGDSRAPRLIMLDEALSGIDDGTRERVLGATVAFDLDVVMTSHELWGTYRSVPQLAIYQLHRENGTFGVHAIPFIWDGEVLRELEQSELLV